MDEHENLPAVIVAQAVVVLTEQRISLVERGLIAVQKNKQQGLSKDKDEHNAITQYQLGEKHYNGDGVPQDYKEAMKWFRLAADQGNADGQRGLGVMYYYGQSVPQNDNRAAHWFRKAAEQGDAVGQCILGVMHYNGQGVPQDDDQAAYWFRKAAEQGDADVQNQLSKFCFRKGWHKEWFDAISPEAIRSWSYGEVKNSETINYSTFKPERNGLFCATIFGPIKDYECLCGKYKGRKHRVMICEKCGVEVTLSKVRRERIGHIELASPVVHIWFLKSWPSRLGMVLDMTVRDIERVINFEAYVVTDPGMSTLERAQLLSEDDYLAKLEEYGDEFSAVMGAEGIRALLHALDVPAEIEKLRSDLEATSSKTKINKYAKRLKILDAFLVSGIKPEWMVMTVLPVLPPDMRPLVRLGDGRFANCVVNVLYRYVINRNNRLKRLLGLKAPEIIVRNEKRMLQDSVNALLGIVEHDHYGKWAYRNKMIL